MSPGCTIARAGAPQWVLRRVRFRAEQRGADATGRATAARGRWTAEINYLANSEGAILLSRCQGLGDQVAVHPGLNRVFVRLSGAGDAITVRATTALAVCLATSGPVVIWRPLRHRMWGAVCMSKRDGACRFPEMLPGLLPDGDVDFRDGSFGDELMEIGLENIFGFTGGRAGSAAATAAWDPGHPSSRCGPPRR